VVTVLMWLADRRNGIVQDRTAEIARNIESDKNLFPDKKLQYFSKIRSKIPHRCIVNTFGFFMVILTIVSTILLICNRGEI